MRKERIRIRSDAAWQFVAALAELPAREWINTSPSVRSPAQESAAADVRRLIRETGTGLTAWFLTDAIDSAAWCCLHTEGNRWGGRQQARLAMVIAAARTAALAILVRPSLGEERFGILYAPFAMLLPIDPPAGSDASHEVFMDSLCAGQCGRANVRGT